MTVSKKTVQEQNLVEVESSKQLSNGIELNSNVFDEGDFNEVVTDLLDKDFLEDVKGVELSAILTDSIEKVINDETKTFVEMHILTEKGLKPVLAGQFKFRDIFNQKNKGNGVAIKFTYKGLIQINGGRTMNDFDIKYKTL